MESTARILQLEEDLIGVTQKGLQKETELDRWAQAGAVAPPNVTRSQVVMTVVKT